MISPTQFDHVVVFGSARANAHAVERRSGDFNSLETRFTVRRFLSKRASPGSRTLIGRLVAADPTLCERDRFDESDMTTFDERSKN